MGSRPPNKAILTLKQAFDVLQSTYTPTGELRKEPKLKIYVVAPQDYNKVRLLGGGEPWVAGGEYGGDVDECWNTYGYHPIEWRQEFHNRKQVRCFHGRKYGSTYFATTGSGSSPWWVVNDTLEKWLLKQIDLSTLTVAGGVAGRGAGRGGGAERPIAIPIDIPFNWSTARLVQVP